MPRNTATTAAPKSTGLDFWAFLKSANKLRQEQRGQGPKEGQPLRLGVMLRCMSTQGRKDLLEKHGFSASAFWSWAAKPINTPAPVLTDVLLYWKPTAKRTIQPEEVWETI